MSLPSGYKRLEYIQSSGTQYIDTGVSANGGTRIVTKVILANWSSFLALFGAIGSDTTHSNYFGVTSAKQWEFRTTGKVNFDQVSAGTAYELDVSTIPGSLKCTINGVDKSVGSDGSDESINRNVYLFAVNDGRKNAAAYNASVTLYQTKIYDSSAALVRDFIPCKNSSGVVGLWDDISGTFYANSGTGVFTAGAEVSGEHTACIDATTYQIQGGRCLIDATGYSILHGNTLINGTSYKIDAHGKIKITIAGNDKFDALGERAGYVTINGTKYASQEELFVDAQTTIAVYTYYNGTGTSSGIYKDGVKVADGRETYSFEATTPCTIRFEAGTLDGIIECKCYITTS